MKAIIIKNEEQIEMLKSALLCLYEKKAAEATKVYDLYESLCKTEIAEPKAEEGQR